jgi:DNA-binding transcriptional LysR family regulator
VGIDYATARLRRRAGDQPTPHEFRAFLRLSEDLHFGRTAKRLGVAQSSLSEAIRRLEAKLDVVLFDRTSRRVQLTEAGLELVPAAREVLQTLAAAHSVVAAPPRSRPTEFRVGIEAHGFAELTRPILAGFIARQPDMRLVTQECAGLPQAFIDGRFDVALLRTPLEDERVQVHFVATEPRGVVVPVDHPAAGTEGASVLEFLDEPFVALGPSIPRTRDYWLGCELRGGDAPRIGGEANNAWETIFGVAHLGLVTLGCRSFVRAFPMAGMDFVGTTDVAPNTLSIVTRANDSRRVVAEFVDLVRVVVSEFRGLSPEISPLRDD